MFLIYKARILNLDHVSEIYIRRDGDGHYVYAEYNASSQEAHHLYKGNQEQCEQFIENLGNHLNNPENNAIHMHLLIP